MQVDRLAVVLRGKSARHSADDVCVLRSYPPLHDFLAVAAHAQWYLAAAVCVLPVLCLHRACTTT